MCSVLTNGSKELVCGIATGVFIISHVLSVVGHLLGRFGLELPMLKQLRHVEGASGLDGARCSAVRLQ